MGGMGGSKNRPGRPRKPKPPMGFVATQADLGAMLGVTCRQAQNMLADGMRFECYDAELDAYSIAKAWEWRVRRQLTKQASPSGADLEDIRAQHEAVKIELSAHKLALARGELISRAEVEDGWARSASIARAGLQTVVDGLPQRIEGKSEDAIRDELRVALVRVADDYAAGGAA